LSDTLDKKELLVVLDKIARAYDNEHGSFRTASAFKSLIIRIERGLFDTKEPVHVGTKSDLEIKRAPDRDPSWDSTGIEFDRSDFIKEPVDDIGK